MASFQAKIGLNSSEREKIKIVVSFRPYLLRNRKCQKKRKKIKKIKKYDYGIIPSQNSLEKAKKERK